MSISINLEVKKVLGDAGRILSGSKGRYCFNNPDHVVVFNANLVVNGTKVWYGDIDLSIDLAKLKQIASTLMEPVLVLYEMDGRFYNEENPLVDKYVVKVNPTAKVEVGTLNHDNTVLRDGGIYLKNPRNYSSEEKPRDIEKNLNISKTIDFGYFAPFLGKGESNEESTPMLRFYKYISKQTLIPMKDLDVSSVYLTWNDYRELKKLEQEFLNNNLFAGADDYTKYKEFSWHWFNFAPNNLGKASSDFKDGTVYIVEK